jgi:hypothetical protein
VNNALAFAGALMVTGALLIVYVAMLGLSADRSPRA